MNQSNRFDNFRISNKWTQIVELDSNFEFNLAFGSLVPTSTATTITATFITSKLVNVFKKEIKKVLYSLQF